MEQSTFNKKQGSAHSSRTIMLEDLVTLLDQINDTAAGRAEYFQAISVRNCLKKRSGTTRLLTFRHLVTLYGLDPSVIIFRALRYFWHLDPVSQPCLAFLCSFERDPILRISADFVAQQTLGAIVTTKGIEDLIESRHPGRFGLSTLKSTARNISSSWSKAGLLKGKFCKTRVTSAPSVGSVCYALFLGHLAGLRGEDLFSCEYLRVIDCSSQVAIEHAQIASQRGWLDFKKVERIMEVRFPQFEGSEK